MSAFSDPRVQLFCPGLIQMQYLSWRSGCGSFPISVRISTTPHRDCLYANQGHTFPKPSWPVKPSQIESISLLGLPTSMCIQVKQEFSTKIYIYMYIVFLCTHNSKPIRSARDLDLIFQRMFRVLHDKISYLVDMFKNDNSASPY